MKCGNAKIKVQFKMNGKTSLGAFKLSRYGLKMIISSRRANYSCTKFDKATSSNIF